MEAGEGKSHGIPLQGYRLLIQHPSAHLSTPRFCSTGPWTRRFPFLPLHCPGFHRYVTPTACPEQLFPPTCSYTLINWVMYIGSSARIYLPAAPNGADDDGNDDDADKHPTRPPGTHHLRSVHYVKPSVARSGTLLAHLSLWVPIEPSRNCMDHIRTQPNIHHHITLGRHYCWMIGC